MNYLNQPFWKYHKNQLFHFVLLLVMSLSLTTFSGCKSDNYGSPTDKGDTEPPEQQGADEVWMVGTSFNVSNLEITVGTTVTWTNKSNVNHTVTSGTRSSSDEGDLFNSGTISPGQSYSYTFSEAGSYNYFCNFHAGMSAKITVTE